MFEIEEYVDAAGRNYFRRWFQGLDTSVQQRVGAALTQLRNGNFSSVKSVGDGVSEMRLHYGAGIRIYYGRKGAQLLLLLAGGTKQRQQKDIALAHRLWTESVEGGM